MSATSKGALPVDSREALQWFVNNFGLYIGSTRGLFITDWAEEREATLEAAIINLKSRGFSPLGVTGDTVYKQADYLWKESRANTQFGRPLASKLELELSGSDIVIIDNLEAPENSRHLWYLYSHILYPRAIAGKATIITTPLSFSEFVKYGDQCPDPDFCGKGLNWEKLLWLLEASLISLDTFKLCREENLPPMLKSEYHLFSALKERGLNVVPQHVLGDFLLDFALIEKERKLNIECDTVSPLGGSETQRQEAKRNLMLLSDGWQVLKFTTSEIIGSKAACADVVDDVWRSGRKRGATGRLLTGNTVAPMPDLPVDDDVQLAAITYGGGPAAVAGGAGTGKTTCIVQRVAYLLGQGVNPDSILILTYSTDTARALKRSIEAVVEKQAFQRLTIASWHDFGLKLLKENLPAIKRKPPLKVEPSPQKIIQRLLTKTKKEIDPAKLELSVDLDEFYIGAVISMYKSHLISPKQAKEEAGTYGEEIIAKIYQQLEDQLQKANRIDRDDVISMSVNCIVNDPELRARMQRQYEFVLVDEYQDSTVAQDMFARLLAAPQDNLFVVGDEDETIAEAKNACPELFTEWSLRIPHARCHILERNWRSHPAIVDHARQLLTGLQRRRMHKEFMSAWGQAPASAIIGPTIANDEHEEANWVANEIQLLVDSGRNFGDIAILYRHHVYATILEEALDDKGVRYQSSNPINNFIPDEVADMMAFLKLVVDPDGPRARESFERICQLRVREVDPKLSATIASFAEANNLSYLKAVEIYSEATADQSCAELNQLVRMVRTMHQERLPPTETIALIRRSQRLNDYYRQVKVPPGVNYEPLKKLTQLEEESRQFKVTLDFVKHVTGQQQSGNGVADTGVQVLPILDCRGLEYPVVFMVGMAEGIFPAQTAIDLEEERRICYVGMTRAKELLYMSYPIMFSGAMLHPSHFLVDARLMVAPPPMVPQMEQPVQPVYEQPVVQPMPVYQEQPVYQQPVYEQPVVPPNFEQPAIHAPSMYEQQMQQVYEQPSYDAAAYQHPPMPVYAEQPAQPVYEQPAAVDVVQALAPSPQVEQPAPEPVYTPPPEPVEPRQRPGRGVAANTPAADPFQIYTAPDAQPARQGMPALPKAKSKPTPEPEAEPIAAPAAQAPVEVQTPAPAPISPATPVEIPAAPGFGRRTPKATPPAVPVEPAVAPTPLQPIEPPAPKPLSAAAAALIGEGDASQQPSWDFSQAWQMPPEQPTVAPAQAPIIEHQPAVVEQQPAPFVEHQPAVVEQQPGPFVEHQPSPIVQHHQAPAQHQAPVQHQTPPVQHHAPPQPDFFDQAPAAFQQAQPQPQQPQRLQPTQHYADLPFASPTAVDRPQPQPAAAPQQHYEQLPYVPQQPYPTQHAQLEHAVSEHHPMCPQCYNPLEANARFCGECGYTLPERIPACPTCGVPLEPSAKFCGECGMSLNAPVAGDSDTVSQKMRQMQDIKGQQEGWVNKIFKALES